MHRTPAATRSIMLAFATVLLMIAGAGNVVAAGVQASKPGLYAGLPGRNGRLVTPTSDSATPPARAAQQLLITTAENAPDLEAGWKTAARAATDLNPQGHVNPPAPPHPVVLTETHAEGRVHTADVHPEDLETSRPVHPGPTHHEGGAAPWRIA